MSSPNVITLTDETFETEILNADVPCLVDYWAEWCMPCKMLSPVIDELADDFAGKARIGKVDTDSCRQVSMKYGVSAIPTIMLFKGGEMVKKFVGPQSKIDLVDAINELI